MRVIAPHYLLLLPCVAFFWWQARRTGTRLRPLAFRCAVFTAIVLALSQLQVIHGDSQASVMLVVDASDSALDAQGALLERANGLLSKLRPGDRAGLVVFGRTARVERALDESRAPFGSVAVGVPGTATDIEGALRAARTQLPDGTLRHMVLLSDGQETQGDALKEAAQAAADGIAIDVWLPEASAVKVLGVSSLSSPATARVGQPFVLTATIQGQPGSSGEVTIERDGEVQIARQVTISPTGTATAVFSDKASAAGVRVYSARVRSLDPPLDEQSSPAGAAITVIGTPHVLYVHDGTVNPGAILRSGFDMAHADPRSVPSSSTALDAYDAVVLDDVAADSLNAAQIAAITAFVEQRGGGLLVLGSSRTLDPGLLPDTPLGALLPIDLRPRTGQRAPQAALVVIYDKSGSMDDRVDGTSKIEYARQGIQKVLEVIPSTDALGVIAFDSSPTEVATLRTGQDPRAVLERVRAIQPGGSTAIAPAMEIARRWLSSGEVARFPKRHVLLISDGRSSEADARALAALARGPFELSAVALGAEADRRFLAGLATASGGRAYMPDNIRDLPSILAREAARVAGGRIVEDTFVPRVLPHPTTSGIDGATAPRLSGYVVGAPKPNAEVTLQSHLEDPLLTGWRYGLGRVAVYTADLHGPWSSNLRGWPSLTPLLSQTMRWLARPLGQDSLYTAIVHTNDGARLVVETDDDSGGYRSLLEVKAVLRGPDGGIQNVTVAESQPGRYEAAMPVSAAGAYAVAVDAASHDGQFNARSQRGFYWQAIAEDRTRGVNGTLLRRLAETTGGQILSAASDPLATRPAGYSDLRPYLLAAAFLLFLGELLVPVARSLSFSKRRPRPHLPAREAA